MLSRHERDRLAEIEAGLVGADPRLAEQFERFDPGPRWRGLRHALAGLALALLAVLAVMCLLSGLMVSAVVLAVATLLGGALCCVQARRNRRGSAPG
ncbi:DUF3040 domain-containing protein [Saccharopolyspora cebuensis]|uniref:DUF3040 domain-containing protein n=1 Tax=Saccharopolyspora cebuensis TaxID=418759 RepID=A0ABV4CQK6_9PSEU